MKDDLAGELGGKCDMLCGGDGQNSSLWASRIADGLLQAGLSSVNVPQPDAGIRGAFHTAEVNVAMQGGEISRPGAPPAPEQAAPSVRDNTPTAPGAYMG